MRCGAQRWVFRAVGWALAEQRVGTGSSWGPAVAAGRPVGARTRLLGVECRTPARTPFSNRGHRGAGRFPVRWAGCPRGWPPEGWWGSEEEEAVPAAGGGGGEVWLPAASCTWPGRTATTVTGTATGAGAGAAAGMSTATAAGAGAAAGMSAGVGTGAATGVVPGGGFGGVVPSSVRLPAAGVRDVCGTAVGMVVAGCGF